MRRYNRYACLLIVALLGYGCASGGVRGTNGENAATARNEGISYFVPYDVLSVKADVVTRKTRAWSRKLNDGRCKVDSAESWVSTSWKIDAAPVADRRRVYRIGLQPAKMRDVSLNLAVSERGLLTSFGYSVADRSAEVAGAVLRGVATIAGIVTGVPAAIPNFVEMMVRDTTLGFVGDSTRKVAAARDTLDRPRSNLECFARSDVDTEALVAEVRGLDSLVRIVRDQYHELLSQASSARVKAVRDGLLAQAAVSLTRLESMAAVFAARDADLSQALARFVVSNRIGNSDTSTTVFAHLDVSQLGSNPPASTALWMPSTTRDLADQRELFERARLIITVSDLPHSTGQIDTAAANDARSVGCEEKKPSACVPIFYRAPRARLVTVFTPSSSDPRAPLLPRASSVYALSSSNDPILKLSLPNKRLRDGSVSLAFGREGSVTGVTVASKATLASSATAFANSIKAAGEGFNEGLSMVQSAQSNLETIRQNARTAKLKELTDRKAVLDAQVALEGAKSNRDLLVEQTRVNLELALLTSQQNLEAAQTNGALSAQMAEMNAEIKRLQVEIQLMTLRMQLDEARARAGQPGGG